MNHVLSTHLFVNHRLTSALLSRAEQAGFPAVEIFCARQHLDYRDRAQVKELGHWFRESQLKLHSLHAPMYNDDIWGRSGPHTHINITERVKGERIRWVDEIKRAVRTVLEQKRDWVAPPEYTVENVSASVVKILLGYLLSTAR